MDWDKCVKLSNKLMVRNVGYGSPDTYAHWCPACKDMHDYYVDTPTRGGARWQYHGNHERPTFTPSMNISWGTEADPDRGRCHYFVTNGQLVYCSDSKHEYAGKTIDLPDIPRHVWFYGGIDPDKE